ncbi:hypothetical protein Tco_1143266 [Tanacetum coccineum]
MLVPWTNNGKGHINGKENVVTGALSRKERVKPRRVRAMAMTIQYGVRGMILAAQSEAFKQENIFAERLHGLDQQMERKEDEIFYFMDHAAESVREAIGFEYYLASSSGWTKSPVLWAEIRESSLTGLELVQETIDKVTPWKGVVCFGKKDKLAPRYVGPFEILERIGLIAYRLRLPEELSNVHDTFHVSNLKKCLTDANLHVPLNEIKIDKTLRFVEEPVEIMDREVKRLKRSRIPLMKVHWNSKRGPEFTWEREDFMKSKYPQLFVDRTLRPVVNPPYCLHPRKCENGSEQLQELQDKVVDALSRKERVKPRRVRAMAMTIRYGVRGMILAAQSEAFKQENVLAERLHGLEQQMERKGDGEFCNFMDPNIGLLVNEGVMDEAHASRYLVHPGADKMYYNLEDMYCKEWNSDDDQLRLRWMIYLVVLADAVECVRDAIGFERKQLEFEVGDLVMLKVSPWKCVVRFGKKGKLASRYVKPFEILERIGPIAYRLRLSEELSGVHDTFHVSNLKKCLVDASLHVLLDEIKVDKTLRFVDEPVEIMECEIKSLKCSKISLVKVHWNSKRGPEFT